MPALIGGRAVEHGLVGRALQVEIERRVDAQARAMHLVDAILALQLPPHLLHKVRRLVVGRRLQVQPQRRCLGGIGLLLRDLVVVQHLLDDQVAALQRALGIAHRRVILRALGQRRQQAASGSVRSRACLLK